MQEDIKKGEEFLKKHWLVLVGVLASVIALWLLLKGSGSSAASTGSTASQAAPVPVSGTSTGASDVAANDAAALQETQLADQLSATQLAAQTQIDLAQIAAGGQANNEATALNYANSQLAAQLQVAEGQQALQTNSVNANAAAYSNGQALQAASSLAPAILRAFGIGGGGQPTTADSGGGTGAIVVGAPDLSAAGTPQLISSWPTVTPDVSAVSDIPNVAADTFTPDSTDFSF